MSKILRMIEDLIWFASCFLLWYSVIVFPILCVIFLVSIISPASENNPNISAYWSGTTGETIYIFAVAFYMWVVGLLYVFKYRKVVAKKRELRYVFIAALLLFAVLCQGQSISHHRKMIRNVRLTTVLIKCFDNETKEPIPISIITSGTSDNKPFPKIKIAAIAHNVVELDVVSNRQDKIELSSEGYETKEIIVGSESENLDIYLKKSDNLTNKNK